MFDNKLMIRPIRPPYISIENWDRMTRKEKDYIYLLRHKQFTKDEIKRTLYITSDQWLRKLSKRVQKFISK